MPIWEPRDPHVKGFEMDVKIGMGNMFISKPSTWGPWDFQMDVMLPEFRHLSLARERLSGHPGLVLRVRVQPWGPYI